jgi:hypothetical protein
VGCVCVQRVSAATLRAQTNPWLLATESRPGAHGMQPSLVVECGHERRWRAAVAAHLAAQVRVSWVFQVKVQVAELGLVSLAA